MSEQEKDSIERLLEDLDRAVTCDSFDGKNVFSAYCGGQARVTAKASWVAVFAEDVSRRLHALMPHDADGREIRVGDTIKSPGGKEERVTDVLPVPAAVKDGGADITTFAMPTLWRVVQPDSWERLEQDVRMTPREYVVKVAMPNEFGMAAIAAMADDIVRRAKALAGVE